MLGLLVRYGHLVVSLQHAACFYARVANNRRLLMIDVR
jgi:hypothetical protein